VMLGIGNPFRHGVEHGSLLNRTSTPPHQSCIDSRRTPGAAVNLAIE
jgi:hypothetical protein